MELDLLHDCICMHTNKAAWIVDTMYQCALLSCAENAFVCVCVCVYYSITVK